MMNVAGIQVYGRRIRIGSIKMTRGGRSASDWALARTAAWFDVSREALRNLVSENSQANLRALSGFKSGPSGARTTQNSRGGWVRAVAVGKYSSGDGRPPNRQMEACPRGWTTSPLSRRR